MSPTITPLSPDDPMFGVIEQIKASIESNTTPEYINQDQSYIMIFIAMISLIVAFGIITQLICGSEDERKREIFYEAGIKTDRA